MAGFFGFRFITVLLVTGNVLQCIAVLPLYLPILQQGNAERGDIIETYFHLGMNYKEILLLIRLTHGFYLSIRQLVKCSLLDKKKLFIKVSMVCRSCLVIFYFKEKLCVWHASASHLREVYLQSIRKK